MNEIEIETSRLVVGDKSRKDELLKWFRFDYPTRLNRINRYAYLGLTPPETRYALEIEAYDKENELRELNGEDKLPPLKMKNIF